MTWYRDVDPVSEPIDMGMVEQGRSERIFNLNIVKAPSTTLLEELVQVLETASVGTYEKDIFVGTKVELPEGDGPFLNIIDDGGTSPERTHNEVWPPAFVRPSVKVVVRGKSYKAVRTMAYAAYNALSAIRNTDVT